MFTDRYQALGVPYPDPDTMCKGECDGTGVYPLHGPCPESGHEASLWDEAHERGHSLWRQILSMLRNREWWYWRATIRDIFRGLPCDGYHFVKCPDCGGTGKRPA